MTKNSSKLESLFCGILFCISIAALVIACLAFTKKKSGSEYYCNVGGASDVQLCVGAEGDATKLGYVANKKCMPFGGGWLPNSPGVTRIDYSAKCTTPSP